MNQKPKTVDEVIADLESQELHPTRQLAREIIKQHRSDQPALTQQQIDSGSETEDRRRRFVSASVKWSRRSLWSKLLRR